MAAPKHPQYRRRNFFVKQWFQVGFALYPAVFLAVFLAAGGFYLYVDVKGALEYYVYLPHSRLANPWEVVGPAVLRVASVGGGAFLAALALWGWLRFSRLHRDLQILADWVGALRRPGVSSRALPDLGDAEVRLLGEGLEKAVAAIDGWEAEVRSRAGLLAAAVEDLERASDGERPSRLAEARLRWKSFSERLSAFRIEEDLG